MNDTLWRICAFLFGCMGARFALTWVARVVPLAWLPVMGLPAMVIAAGFAVIYINGWRKTGPEVRGGVIWWNALRPVHAALWFTFGVMALARQRDAWVVLLVDTLIGLAAFSAYHLGFLS